MAVKKILKKKRVLKEKATPAVESTPIIQPDEFFSLITNMVKEFSNDQELGNKIRSVVQNREDKNA